MIKASEDDGCTILGHRPEGLPKVLQFEAATGGGVQDQHTECNSSASGVRTYVD